MTDTTEASTIATIAQQAAKPNKLDPGAIYAVPDDNGGIKVVTTDDYAASPRRVTRSAIARDPATFLAYLDYRGVGGGPLEVWADLNSRSITGIIDGGAGWRGDRVTLQLEHSAEWLAWSGASGNLSSQAAFSDFLEDQISVIAEPDGAVLLEIVQSIQGSTKATWQSADWLDNGARAFAWVEEVEAKAGRKGKLEIPSRFTLGLRPFTTSEPFRVTANLRYRIDHGNLLIGFKLPELVRVVESAFSDVVNEVSAGLLAPVFIGKP